MSIFGECYLFSAVAAAMETAHVRSGSQSPAQSLVLYFSFFPAHLPVRTFALRIEKQDWHQEARLAIETVHAQGGLASRRHKL